MARSRSPGLSSLRESKAGIAIQKDGNSITEAVVKRTARKELPGRGIAASLGSIPMRNSCSIGLLPFP